MLKSSRCPEKKIPSLGESLDRADSNFLDHLKDPEHFLLRHTLFSQTNHLLREYHPGSMLLSNQTPFDFWAPMVLHALYHASTLLKTLLLSCHPDDFRGWMYELRLPPKACAKLGIKPKSIDQVVTFWKALFSIQLFLFS